ncbi:MAG TPA: hypothetical protein VGD10_09660 [Allosphingosinicella sp.]|uniref:hypothetical protein n=1 Tax=Allosphingosinicella sp. TaxID=2823234 RepID=UPI002ED96F90
MNLEKTLSAAAAEQPLGQSINSYDYSTGGTDLGGIAVSITTRNDLQGRPEIAVSQAGLTYEDVRKAKAVAGLALSRLSPKTALALGFSESGKALAQRLAGQSGASFLAARDPMTRTGFQATGNSSLAIRHSIAGLGFTMTAERGAVGRPGAARFDDEAYTISSLTADGRLGPAQWSLGISRLREEKTVLGGRFSEAYSAGGSTSNFADASLQLPLGAGWDALASYRFGRTAMGGTGALSKGGRLSSDAFSFDLVRRGAFDPTDQLAFRVTQPLRVRSGGYALNVPVSYDYATGAVGYEARLLSLAPTGREIDYEVAYGVAFLNGYLGLNAFLRTEPGHVDANKDDKGAAVKVRLSF